MVADPEEQAPQFELQVPVAVVCCSHEAIKAGSGQPSKARFSGRLSTFGASVRRQYAAQPAITTETVKNWKTSYRKWVSMVINSG